MGWERCVAHKGEMRNPYTILVGNPEENRPLRRPKRRWKDNADFILKNSV
jgi:hypothetical protein